jgi:hypothetical protein
VSLSFFPDKELTYEREIIFDSIQAKIILDLVVSEYAIDIKHNFTKEEITKISKRKPNYKQNHVSIDSAKDFLELT